MRGRKPSRISTVVVLPAPFGPEQPEDFAGADFKIDAFHGRKIAVRLV